MTKNERFWLLFENESPFSIGSWLRRVKCRVFHGHIMVDFGSSEYYERDGKKYPAMTYYMCARCLKCEILYKIN